MSGQGILPRNLSKYIRHIAVKLRRGGIKGMYLDLDGPCNLFPAHGKYLRLLGLLRSPCPS
jgi:hypothetical protein